MKSLVHLIVLCTVFSLVVSCQKEDELTKSRIIVPQESLKPLDVYIRRNFITPYNIDVIYNADIQYSDNSRAFMIPASEQKIRYILDFYKDVWIKSFNEAGGSDFIKDSGISRITLFGSISKPPPDGNPGQGADAAGGIAIRVYNVKNFKLKPVASDNYDLIAILHEYTHILDQVSPKDIKFRNITPKPYGGAQAPLNLSPLESGYITRYAGSSPNEDFAEMSSHMLVMTEKEWERTIDNIPNERKRNMSYDKNDITNYENQLSQTTDKKQKKELEDKIKVAKNRIYYGNKVLENNIKEAQDKIREKAAYMISYYKDNYGIDFKELRAAVLKNFKEFYEKHKK